MKRKHTTESAVPSPGVRRIRRELIDLSEVRAAGDLRLLVVAPGPETDPATRS